MADPFIGQIMQVAFNYAPVDWAPCNGQIINVNQNQALAALIGNTYGGTLPNTIGLPNAQGRVLAGVGTNGTDTPVTLGQMTGTATTVMTQAQMPAHSHAITIASSGGLTVTPTARANVPVDNLASVPPQGGYLANTNDTGSGSQPGIYVPATGGGDPVNLAPITATIPSGGLSNSVAGSSQPMSLMQPTLGITTIIALQGIWPTHG